MAKAYCVACKKKVDIKGAAKFKTDKGQPGLKGKCDKCNGKVSVFVKK